jgi:multidrug efflux pump subunit AcrA (membrane-fusion protein)
MPDFKDDLAALHIERKPERGSRRWVGWLVVLVLLAAAGGGAWMWARRERPIDVEAVVVTQRAAGSQAAVLNASGYVTARRRATVSSKITGKVMEVNVEEGQAVQQGQVLARLDDATYRAALALAQANLAVASQSVHESEVRLAEARVTLGRMTQLLKDIVVGQAELDKA